VWIYSVHEYLDNDKESIKSKSKKFLEDMIGREIRNSRHLIEIWKKAPIDWMIVSKNKQTPFIYGDNFPALMKKRIQLMEKYKHSEPFIDPHFMFQVKNNPYQ